MGIAGMNKSLFVGIWAGAVLIAAPAFAATTNPSVTNETASNVVTGQAVVRELSAMTVGGIGARIGGFLSPQLLNAQGVDPDRASLFALGNIGTGMSAGGGDGRLGIWVSGAWSSIDNDLVSTAYDGNLYSALFGADYQMNDRFLAGIALGYESSDIDTTFNTGHSESDGFTIAPYAGYVLNRYFTVDVSGGFTFVDYDTRRTASGSSVSGRTESTRWFIAGNVNAYYAIDRITLGGKMGYSYTRENMDGFTESNSTTYTDRDYTIGQFRLGGTVGYQLGKVEPYLLTTYVYDAQMTEVAVGAGQASPKNDRSGFDVGGGINFMLSDRVIGGFEGSTHVGRENFDSTTLSGNLRIKF